MSEALRSRVERLFTVITESKKGALANASVLAAINSPRAFTTRDGILANPPLRGIYEKAIVFGNSNDQLSVLNAAKTKQKFGKFLRFEAFKPDDPFDGLNVLILEIGTARVQGFDTRVKLKELLGKNRRLLRAARRMKKDQFISSLTNEDRTALRDLGFTSESFFRSANDTRLPEFLDEAQQKLEEL